MKQNVNWQKNNIRRKYEKNYMRGGLEIVPARAHNPNDVGAIPTPATKVSRFLKKRVVGFSFLFF